MSVAASSRKRLGGEGSLGVRNVADSTGLVWYAVIGSSAFRASRLATFEPPSGGSLFDCLTAKNLAYGVIESADSTRSPAVSNDFVVHRGRPRWIRRLSNQVPSAFPPVGIHPIMVAERNRLAILGHN